MNQTIILLIVFELVFLCGCSQMVKPRVIRAPVQEQRVSDRYARESVQSHEVFDINIEGHVVILAHLATGERFPMLCQKMSNGIQAIPQSVFAESGAERWRIMCEPEIVRDSEHIYALMRLNLSRVEGKLHRGDLQLKRLPKTRLLFGAP